MKIVWSAPPSLVYDQTPHYYQALFSAAAVYLRRRFPEADIRTEASGFHGHLSRFLLQHFHGGEPVDYMVIWARPWEAKAAYRMARTASLASPGTRIFVWGESCLYMPQYFTRDPFHLLVQNGDPELVIADAIERMEAGLEPEHGVLFRTAQGWHESEVGRTLDPAEWTFPDLDSLDSDVHAYWTRKRGRSKLELSFMLSRGCPINCARWCPTPRKEGTFDRRRSPEETVAYMDELPAPYEVFQMHSPLFSYHRPWLQRFIQLRRSRRTLHPFKVVDVMNPYAEEEMVGALAEVGMSEVGFGVESLSRSGRTLIPKMEPSRLEKVAENLHRHGVKGKAYVQIGLPGQSREDLLFTLRVLRDLGLHPRPTGSTPFWKLTKMSIEELDGLELETWDRKSYYEPRCGLSYGEFLYLIDDPRGFMQSLEEGGAQRWAA